ncbi:GlxA family transcriptional regulator [Undibacterium parvum]|uniref:Helix-turn-helix domain-containing protein n=1 Tax=Undibacterium parvum TaxID=401471 RepID=A0A3S9HLJ9_9BURK|nr:helix-turn-helix domain-containing protein [Undibacterium parvum]AZP12987.1 helix-turn-helix domain-containing protein [Undibacterium parvum]
MRKQSIYFLLLPETMLSDLAGPADAFLFANRHQTEVEFELEFISALPEIRCSIGLSLGPLSALPDTLAEDAIVVLPGLVGMQFDYAGAADQLSLSWLKNIIQPQHRLICICSGALTAAHAGLLRGRRATTHHSHCADLAAIDASILVEENRIFVEDGNICSSAGVTAGVDLVLHLISGITSPQTAIAVARAMVVYMRRSGNDTQLSPWLRHRNHVHPVVHKVQEVLIKDPAHAWDLTQLAELACTSTRHLSRLFSLYAEISVQEYLSSLRLSLADQLLSQTDWSVERVAEAAGFGSPRQFRRVWQSAYATPPSAHPHRRLTTRH